MLFIYSFPICSSQTLTFWYFAKIRFGAILKWENRFFFLFKNLYFILRLFWVSRRNKFKIIFHNRAKCKQIDYIPCSTLKLIHIDVEEKKKTKVKSEIGTVWCNQFNQKWLAQRNVSIMVIGIRSNCDQFN